MPVLNTRIQDAGQARLTQSLSGGRNQLFGNLALQRTTSDAGNVFGQAQLRATTNAAIRANVALHPIDARGLVAMAPLGDASRPSPGGIGMFTGQMAQNTLTSFQRSQDTLYSLAKDTGGHAMFDYNDLSLGIVQAAQSMTSYDMVGYYSTHPATDGRFHRVRVSLRSGVAGELAYRAGYFADKEFAKFTLADKERQLEEALMLDNPVTDISTAMELYVFLQAYQRGAAAPQPLVVFVSFHRGDVKAFETAPLLVTDGMDAKTRAVPLRCSLPLESFTTGRYDCQVTVIDPTAEKIAFWRAPIVIVR